MKVLHITAHMGGGVGNFLSAALSYKESEQCIDIEHKIICLEQPKNWQFITLCEERNISVEIASGDMDVKALVWADIIVVHWWHCPSMCPFLANFPSIDVRMILMCHISGCNYPYLPAEFALEFDEILFTSFYSYENAGWNRLQRQKIIDKSEVVYGLGKDDVRGASAHVQEIKSQEKFRILYVGTLEYSKIHPGYVDFCRAVVRQIPNARFIMVGAIDVEGKLYKDIMNSEIKDYFDFVGYTQDVRYYLAQSDVFGYPLNPFHFGTTENVILEAMAEGLPVVLLNQNTEKYIVKNLKNGLLADNIETYAECMVYLYNHPEECIRLGDEGRNTVHTTFNFDDNVNHFIAILKKVGSYSKRKHSFKEYMGITPYEWFIHFTGTYKPDFEKGMIKNIQEIFCVKSKSSILHFMSCFPEDEQLKSLAEKL